MEYYREEIMKALKMIEDEKFLQYIYILIKEMIAKS